MVRAWVSDTRICSSERQINGHTMKLDALDHPKTLDFAARLSVELPTAIGYLELLWAFTGKKAPQGNIGKWPDGAIARACYWMGRPEVFILALHESGFIDADSVHRFTIHDWPEHAPRWVKAKLKSMGLAFVSASTETVGETTGEDTEGDAGLPSKGREGKASEEKGREKNAHASARSTSPPGLDAKAWERWEGYRTQIRKPLKPVSIPAAQLALAAFGSEQAAVVEQSVANGWQGLFPLKLNGNGQHPRAPPVKYRTADEIEAEERARGDFDAQH